jgi:agmatinase
MLSHLDTWKPSVFGGAPTDQAAINHGTYFYWVSGLRIHLDL